MLVNFLINSGVACRSNIRSSPTHLLTGGSKLSRLWWQRGRHYSDAPAWLGTAGELREAMLNIFS